MSIYLAIGESVHALSPTIIWKVSGRKNLKIQLHIIMCANILPINLGFNIYSMKLLYFLRQRHREIFATMCPHRCFNFHFTSLISKTGREDSSCE